MAAFVPAASALPTMVAMMIWLNEMGTPNWTPACATRNAGRSAAMARSRDRVAYSRAMSS
jgi:hypothetical protein